MALRSPRQSRPDIGARKVRSVSETKVRSCVFTNRARTERHRAKLFENFLDTGCVPSEIGKGQESRVKKVARFTSFASPHDEQPGSMSAFANAEADNRSMRSFGQSSGYSPA
jgi:hypothetical protein